MINQKRRRPLKIIGYLVQVEEDQKQSMTGPARISFLETAVLGMIPVRIVDPMAILEVQFIQMELQANPVIQVIQAMQIQMVQVHSVM